MDNHNGNEQDGSPSSAEADVMCTLHDAGVLNRLADLLRDYGFVVKRPPSMAFRPAVELDFSVRTANCLQAAYAHALSGDGKYNGLTAKSFRDGELMATELANDFRRNTEGVFLQSRNFRRRQLQEVEDVLKDNGLI